MEFLRLCSFHDLSGDDLLRFKQLVNDDRVDVNKTYQDGLSPLDVLFFNFNNSDSNLLELVQLLLERGANVNDKLLLEVCGNSRIKENVVEMVKLFIERGCDVNAKNKDGRTPLVQLFKRYAGNNDDLLINLFQALVDAGADVTVRTVRGRNLLHLIFQGIQDHSSKIIDLVRYLIEKGVDVNARDMNGENPLHILCRSCTNEETLLSLVQLFKENGVDLGAETKQGKTASFLLRVENDARLKMDKVIQELST